MATFGYESIGGSSDTTANSIRGSVFTITENGTATSITAYIDPKNTSSDYKAAIYLHSDSSLVGETDEIVNIADASAHWQTFNFSTQPELTSGIAYILVVWSNGGPPGGADVFHYDTGDTNQGHYDSQSYNGFPDPATFTHTNFKHSIYCTYTPAAPAGTNIQVNVDDALKEVAAGIVNVDDVWKTLAAGIVNVDDVWKTIF